jgi:hypothetical protein
MKIRSIAFVMFASLAFSGTAFGACNAPEDPQIPAGASASGADMLKAKKAVEAYVSAAEEYMSCGVASALQERMAGRMEKVVDSFNKELREYKAKE